MIPERQVYQGLAEIFAEVFLRNDIVLSPDLTAKDVEGWDSIKQVELIMASEQRFKIRFTSGEVDRLRTLGDLAGIVSRRGQ